MLPALFYSWHTTNLLFLWRSRRQMSTSSHWCSVWMICEEELFPSACRVCLSAVKYFIVIIWRGAQKVQAASVLKIAALQMWSPIGGLEMYKRLVVSSSQQYLLVSLRSIAGHQVVISGWLFTEIQLMQGRSSYRYLLIQKVVPGSWPEAVCRMRCFLPSIAD